MLKQWIPNIITLLLAGLLVITQQVWAGSLVARLTSTTTASSKTTINYQGYLTDAAGTPVNDTLDMVFRLYGVEAGGEALWAESHNGVPVADGLFSVLLGGSMSDPNPIPPSLFAENDSLWLGISVGGDEEMVPREQLASAPSAMTVPDGSVTTVQLADSAVTSAKIQDGAVTQSKLSGIRMYVGGDGIPVDGQGKGCKVLEFPGGRFARTPRVFVTRQAIGPWEDNDPDYARTRFIVNTHDETSVRVCVDDDRIYDGYVGVSILAIQTD